ncbi:MAG: hypothetical protein ACP5NI_04150 [Acetobacteraceae bacterium]
MSEVKASAHLMTLDAGLYYLLHNGARAAGFPGVGIGAAPGAAAGAVEIRGFREDGWVGGGEAVLIRVNRPQAQVLVTIYQAAGGVEAAPRIEVRRIADGSAAPVAAAPAAAAAPAPEPRRGAEVLAHVQRQGDVAGRFGDWVGERGGQRWIEGFALAAPPGLAPAELTYQAVLGRGWLSPWAEAGQFCGSRGMALPILGLNVTLLGAAAQGWECTVEGSFVDGAACGPVAAGEACVAESLAPLEAFRVVLTRRAEAAAPGPGPAGGARAKAPRPAAAAKAGKAARRKP